MAEDTKGAYGEEEGGTGRLLEIPEEEEGAVVSASGDGGSGAWDLFFLAGGNLLVVPVENPLEVHLIAFFVPQMAVVAGSRPVTHIRTNHRDDRQTKGGTCQVYISFGHPLPTLNRVCPCGTSRTLHHEHYPFSSPPPD